MTQKLRERLNFIAGRLEGIAYGVDNEKLCDVIMKCSEDIDKILCEDSSRPVINLTAEADIVKCCRTCKNETLPATVYPCNECWYGNGSDLRTNHWEEKTDENA